MVEPQYPAAVDRYVNLGRFYRLEELKPLREEVMTYTGAYKPPGRWSGAFRS